MILRPVPKTIYVPLEWQGGGRFLLLVCSLLEFLVNLLRQRTHFVEERQEDPLIASGRRATDVFPGMDSSEEEEEEEGFAQGKKPVIKVTTS